MVSSEKILLDCQCVTWRKLGEQLMSELQSEKSPESPPFTSCGVDFFVPFTIKN